MVRRVSALILGSLTAMAAIAGCGGGSGLFGPGQSNAVVIRYLNATQGASRFQTNEPANESFILGSGGHQDETVLIPTTGSQSLAITVSAGPDEGALVDTETFTIDQQSLQGQNELLVTYNGVKITFTPTKA